MVTYPTVVLVPGSFVYSYMYEPLLVPLREKGYTTYSLDPPCYPKSYKENSPAPTMVDDAEFIHNFIEKLADEGQDVLILAASYGGMPSSQAMKGLSKRERQAEGKKGGVVRMAFLTCIVPKLGESLGQVISAAGEGGAPSMDVDEFGWMTHTDYEATAKMVFNDLPLEQGIIEAKKFGHHSGPSFANELTYNGYKDVPASWLFCENDKCISPEVQQIAIDTIQQSWKGTERDGKKVDVTRLASDHSGLAPGVQAKVVQWIEDAIKKGEQD